MNHAGFKVLTMAALVTLVASVQNSSAGSSTSFGVSADSVYICSVTTDSGVQDKLRLDLYRDQYIFKNGQKAMQNHFSLHTIHAESMEPYTPTPIDNVVSKKVESSRRGFTNYYDLNTHVGNSFGVAELINSAPKPSDFGQDFSIPTLNGRRIMKMSFKELADGGLDIGVEDTGDFFLGMSSDMGWVQLDLKYAGTCRQAADDGTVGH